MQNHELQTKGILEPEGNLIPSFHQPLGPRFLKSLFPLAIDVDNSIQLQLILSRLNDVRWSVLDIEDRRRIIKNDFVSSCADASFLFQIGKLRERHIRGSMNRLKEWVTGRKYLSMIGV